MISLGRHRLCPLGLHTGAPTGAPTGVPLQPPLGFHWGYRRGLRCTMKESVRVWYFVFGMLAPSDKCFTYTFVSAICVGGCDRMFCVWWFAGCDRIFPDGRIGGCPWVCCGCFPGCFALLFCGLGVVFGVQPSTAADCLYPGPSHTCPKEQTAQASESKE
jgi:hypothetical protein